MAAIDYVPIRRALISVSDKSGIVELAGKLHQLGVEILSTGGTARLLRKQALPVVEIASYTGFPELMDGRVKTLHPRIHGGLLGRRGVDDAAMAAHDIAPIDLLVANLYPFEQTVAASDCNLTAAIENIDIGGPAMVRAAAKNYAAVAVATSPLQYPSLIAELGAHGGSLSAATRFRLAIAAFNRVAQYDAAISNYLSGFNDDGQRQPFPGQANAWFSKLLELRYGENPHQQAAFYRDPEPASGTLATFHQRQGKTLSYNNIADADAAWECVRQFREPACAIVKHANPCGAAVAGDSLSAYQRAYQTDPTSAFGGIIAVNGPLDAVLAQAIVQRQFVEVIVAPSVSADALAVTAAKGNVRVLEIAPGAGRNSYDVKRVGGGLLVQSADNGEIDSADLKVVTRRAPSEREMADLLFAWRVAKFVKSNAIVYARDGMTVGIGAGQMSRVVAARIAGLKAADAGLSVAGSVLASDAFFPFRDGIDAAAEAGIHAVIQPGGSVRDNEVIAAADQHELAMVFTGMRHFRH